jgi:UDPglucose 6-dehydrogenase
MRIYDKHQHHDTLKEVAESDYIYVCVWTPEGDTKDLMEVCDKLSEYGARGWVIIKSTAPPETTQKIKATYPSLKLVYSPEFLTAASAADDYENPDRVVIGLTASLDESADAIKHLTEGYHAPSIITTATTAELIKYSLNSYYAMKVVFANIIYDIAEACGADYESIRAAFYSDRKNVYNHFDVEHGGYRGYGGACLPKDIRTLIRYCDEHGLDANLLKETETKNNKLKGAQK